MVQQKEITRNGRIHIHGPGRLGGVELFFLEISLGRGVLKQTICQGGAGYYMSQADSPKKFKGVKKAYNYELCRYSCSCKQLKKMMNFFPMTKKKKKQIRRASRAETRKFSALRAENFPRGSSFFLTLGRGRPTLRVKIHASGGVFCDFLSGGVVPP